MTNTQDLAALKDYLDWWVVEENPRRDREPELFMLHAVINLASGSRIDFVGKSEPRP